MKILLFDIGSYIQRDLLYYLKKGGCTCRNLLYKVHDLYKDEYLEKKFDEKLRQDSYDIVMSTNFIPIIAKICHRHNTKYISWVYDSPVDTEQTEYYQYSTNYIFLFDRIEAERIKGLGNINVHHLPLAANFERTGSISVTSEDRLVYSSDISFVGQFYSIPLKGIMKYAEDYERGYIDALIESQLKVYGYDFVEEMVTEEIFQKINTQLGHQNLLSRRGLIHGIQKHITHLERLILCNMLGRAHQINYYSTEKSAQLDNLHYCGTADYFNEMPKIFRLSKLNLNPTLRSIRSGIPLRALDILSCGGVLFSNYQLELAEYFEDGVDVIMYESIEDALDKADYYIKNEEIRLEIARKGYQKAFENFAYPDRIVYMFKMADI